MIDFLLEPLQYAFMVRGIVAAILVGIVCAVVGTYVVLRGMAFFGVLFSIYLTFLEPFVIGATCMWCISSAVIQTIIFLASSDSAKRAWQEDDFDEEDYEDSDPNEAVESDDMKSSSPMV